MCALPWLPSSAILQVAQGKQREHTANEHKSKLSVELNAALQQLDAAQAESKSQLENMALLKASQARLQQQVREKATSLRLDLPPLSLHAAVSRA